jgi:integrase
MASIRQRKTGWSVLWREDGKQRSRAFTKESDARAYAQRLDAGTADVQAAGRGNVLFGQYVRTIYVPRARLRPSTKNGMMSAMNGLPELETKTLAWVASHRTEVEDVIAQSPRLDHGQFSQLVKRACDDAVSRGYIESHRLAKLNVKRHYGRRELIEDVTTEQRQAIADALGERGLAVWLMHGCGMRVGEVMGLKGSDFRESFRIVRIQRKAYHGVAGPLKSKQEGFFRDVPVPAWLTPMVKAHVAKHGLGPLFPGSNGKEFVSYKAIGDKISKTAKAIGLRGEDGNAFTPHQFRHAFATQQLRATNDVFKVAKWLGDDPKMITEVYGHVLRDDTLAAVDNVAM